jgi:hypothetical protein
MIARGGLAQRAPRKSLRQYYQDGKKVDPFRKGIELIAGIEQFLPSKSGKFPGAVSQTPGRTTIKPYASPARPHGTQTERLETLLKDDPALGLYNLANLKGYTSITDPTERAKALKDFGYFEPDTGISYVENLEKLGTGDKTLDEQLAATIGHEQTHALFEDQRFKDIITNMNLSKPRSAYGKGWFDEMGYFHEGVKAPSYEPEELLTRLLDVQRYGEAANSDWYFGESPYAISLHPSGEYGTEGLKKTLAPKAKEFITRVKELTTPVVQAPDVSDRHPPAPTPTHYGFDDSGSFTGEGLTTEELDKMDSPAPPAPTHYDEPSWSGDSGDSGSSDSVGQQTSTDYSDWGSDPFAKGGLAQRAPRKSMLKGGRVDKALTGRSRDI